METIQVVLDQKLLQATDKVARRLKRNRSALVRDAPGEHLRRLEALALDEPDRQGLGSTRKCWVNRGIGNRRLRGGRNRARRSSFVSICFTGGEATGGGFDSLQHNVVTVSKERMGRRVARLKQGKDGADCVVLRIALGCDGEG